jgi:diadenosine tetraphosphate (Ap4A) HIT family hydrolase
MELPDTAMFASTPAFRRAFEQGLERLLDAGDLNLFILVAANAGFEASLFADLGDLLKQHLGWHSERLRDAFVHGNRLDEADDDLLVFLKIAFVGFDALALTEQRKAGIWEVQFNHMRSFRPMRHSQRPMTSIRSPFNTQGFNFNRPFMQQEVLWSGEMLGKHFDLYYNKYPFVELHCLLVPERENCLPQFHLQEMHTFVWQLVKQLAPGLPGIRIGYNALGAFASVNHLHYQLFVREQALPVEAAQWVHNGGEDAYPVDCRHFTGVDEAWRFIDGLHAGNEAYNLLYTADGMYCMSRRKQGDFRLADWSSGFSWYEMSGGLITFNQQDYTALQAQRITAELGCARLDSEGSV